MSRFLFRVQDHAQLFVGIAIGMGIALALRLPFFPYVLPDSWANVLVAVAGAIGVVFSTVWGVNVSAAREVREQLKAVSGTAREVREKLEKHLLDHLSSEQGRTNPDVIIDDDEAGSGSFVSEARERLKLLQSIGAISRLQSLQARDKLVKIFDDVYREWEYEIDDLVDHDYDNGERLWLVPRGYVEALIRKLKDFEAVNP